MSEPHDQDGARPDRRTFLTLAGAATLAAAGRPSVGHADDQLDALMGDAQRGDLGQGFDDASRTIQMPKASLPTLSPATVQTPSRRSTLCAAIVARGGWPGVAAVTTAAARRPPSERHRRCARGWSRPATSTRTRSATTSTIPTSRLRCGASRRATASPSTASSASETLEGAQRAGAGAARPAQGQSGAAAHAQHQPRPALRGLQHSGGAHRGDRERRRGVAPHRGRRQARPAVARDQQQDRRDQFQSVLDRAGLDRAQGPHPEDAGPSRTTSPATTSASSTSHHNELQPSQINWYSEEAANYTFKPGSGRASIRSARSASTSRARTASTCTTRRSRICSARISASIPRAACGCRTCASWWPGCLSDTRGWSRHEIDA